MNYYSETDPPTPLLRYIPADAKVVLEVGCGDGTSGLLYKQVNPGCHYIGVESDPEAAKSATQHLDRVLLGNIEDLDFEQLKLTLGEIDCISYNRTLASVRQPDTLLKRHVTWLKPDGLMLACLPNLQHWQHLLTLLRGDADAEDWGIMHRFTPDRARTLFEQAGLKVFEIHPLDDDSAEYEPFEAQVYPILETLQIDPPQFTRAARVREFAVRAIASSRLPQRLLVQTLMQSTIASDQVRVYQPDRLSCTIPGVRTFSLVRTTRLDYALPDEAKIFIWQRDRLSWDDVMQKQRILLNLGYLIVVEIDDDPRFWPEHIEHDFITFRSCHCIQTSTEPLAEFLRQFNPHVHIFPNQLPFLPPLRVPNREDSVTLFFGAINRERDCEPFLPILNRVLVECGSKVRVQVIHDRFFFEALDTSHKQFEALCPYDRYHELLRQCDIAWLPLNDTEFNQMKSDLKFIECAGHGVTVLASPTVYERSVVDGVTGSIYRSPEEFEAKLRQLIHNATLRQQLAQNAYAWVRENRLLYQHYRQRYDWYVSLLEKRDELTASLYERVPELRC
jgi:SAM-dependent methyltransferase/glycosyltransferase involved in cell wall biosynthesis